MPLLSTLRQPEGRPFAYYYNSVGAPRASHEQGIGGGLTCDLWSVKVCSSVETNSPLDSLLSLGGSKDATVQSKDCKDHE